LKVDDVTNRPETAFWNRRYGLILEVIYGAVERVFRILTIKFYVIMF